MSKRTAIGLIAVLAGLLAAGGVARANNITVTNVVMFGQVENSHWLVRFDIQWENSWRKDSVSPYNHDAAWVFLKWRSTSGSTTDWQRATLGTNVTDHVAPTGCTIAVGLDGRRDAWGTNGVGVFVYRSADGAGTFSKNVRLRWNYAADGAGGGAQLEVKVCAIEMVYVPEGAFYLGSGGGETGHFYKRPTSTNPFLVTNETDAITVGTVDGNLYYVDVGGSVGDGTGIISNAYPKGYAAFYCMKYEISQGQYADFLNTLTYTQATNRWPNYGTYRYAITNVGGVYSSTNPYVACNWLSWADGSAYADWAGLRPLTELEYEKACRGTNAPVANEYAWGNTSITLATNIINAGQANEAPLPIMANCVASNQPGVQGPMRVGCMGVATGERERTGAGYYGIMELSGNLWERPVTVGANTGRAFTGLHGNGVLTLPGGDADVSGWPGTNADGAGYRGGTWYEASGYARVSDRGDAAYVRATRYAYYGWRGVRAAPSGVGP